MTRQAREQRRLRTHGLCVVCRQQATPNKARCAPCLARDNERSKARQAERRGYAY